MICIFFGHKDTPSTVYPLLRENISALVRQGVNTFYFGQEGRFDHMVAKALQELKATYPHIQCVQILAYLPTSASKPLFESIYPSHIETVPKRFAISFRNRWMVQQADHVICYIDRPFGGAAQFVHLAQKRGCRIWNIATPPTQES